MKKLKGRFYRSAANTVVVCTKGSKSGCFSGIVVDTGANCAHEIGKKDNTWFCSCFTEEVEPRAFFSITARDKQIKENKLRKELAALDEKREEVRQAIDALNLEE